MSHLFDDPLPEDLESIWLGLLSRVTLGEVAPRPPVTTPDAEAMQALYGPLATHERFVIAQMGQSLDGCIATRTGASHYVTGRESLVHLHRLRALVDAVVIGPGTATADDPRLTVRLVEGRSPVRVVIDLQRLLPADLRAFEGEAVRVVAAGAPKDDAKIDEIEIEAPNGRFEPHALVAALAERGLGRVLVEGGGRVVSSFLRERALDRLHVAVAPLLIGEGIPGVVPPPVDDLADAIRPPSRTYRMGDDVLFDLDLSAPRTSATSSDSSESSTASAS